MLITPCSDIESERGMPWSMVYVNRRLICMLEKRYNVGMKTEPVFTALMTTTRLSCDASQMLVNIIRIA